MLNVPYSSQERPPFVRFEEQENGVNHEASQAAGRPVPKFTIMACITSFGSKDCFVKPAEDWIFGIRQKAIKGEFNPEWVKRFELQFEEFKKGHELPREGTALQTCPLYTKDQVARARAIDVTTVEDLAQVPDSGINMLGLDGRHMRDSARAWIAEAKDKGIVSLELADANLKISEQAERIKSLEARLGELESKGKSKAA